MKKAPLLTALTITLSLATLDIQAQSESKSGQDLEDFRNWMNKRVSLGDSVTRAEWPAIKQEFQTRTQMLDRNRDQLTTGSQQEYSKLKSQYQAWGNVHEEAYSQPLRNKTAAAWERRLAGTSKIDQPKASQVRDTFTRFMENVRAQRTDWTLRDWEYAEQVYQRLSGCKQQVLDQMNSSDKIKVAAL